MIDWDDEVEKADKRFDMLRLREAIIATIIWGLGVALASEFLWSHVPNEEYINYFAVFVFFWSFVLLMTASLRKHH